MAYMSVRARAGSYNSSTNSTTVYADVYIYWSSSQSYNQMNQTGTLTIGGSTFTFSTNFNENRTSSGSKLLCSASATIKHNSNGDKMQLVVSASGAGYSASDIVTLSGGTPSGGGSSGGGGDTGGGGDSGGGDTGGGDSGDTGGGDTGGGGGSSGDDNIDFGGDPCYITSEVSENAHLYIYYGSPGEDPIWRLDPTSPGSDSLPERFTVELAYEVDKGYIATVHTVNGVSFESGYTFSISEDIHIIIETEVDTTVKLTSKEELDLYMKNLFPTTGGIGGSEVEKQSASTIAVGVATIGTSDIKNNKYFSYIYDNSKWSIYSPYIYTEELDVPGWAYAYITASSLNIRSQMNTNSSSIIEALPQGSLVTLKDWTYNSSNNIFWGSINYKNGVSAYCDIQYLDYLVEGITNKETEVYRYDNLSSSSYVGTIPQGSSVLIFGKPTPMGDEFPSFMLKAKVFGYDDFKEQSYYYIFRDDIDFPTSFNFKGWIPTETLGYAK